MTPPSPSITAAPSSDGAGAQTETVEPAVFVIFGATGDLARRKILPALWQLHAHKLTDRGLVILGVLARLGRGLVSRDCARCDSGRRRVAR